MRFPLTHPPIGLTASGERSILIALGSLVPFAAGAAIAWRETRHLDAAVAAAAFVAIVLVAIIVAQTLARLSYHGLGELALFAAYGPGIVLGSVLLLGGTISGAAVDASIMLGILAALVLITNELPDERADRIAGKRTLVVRMGRDLATSFIAVLFAMAFAIPLASVAFGGLTYFLGALAGVPTSYAAWILLRREYDRAPIAAQAATRITYVVTGAGLAIGAIVL